MSSILDWAHFAMRWSHIGLGGFGLLLFWVPVFARKGSKLHINAGKLFTWVGYYVASTALIASAWALAAPASFLGPRFERMDAARLAEQLELLSFLMLILLFLSVAVIAGLIYGRQVVKYKTDHQRLRSPLLLGMEICMGFLALALIVSGITHLVQTPGLQRYWIHILLGGFGLYGLWEDLRYILGPPPTERMAWMYRHMECMLGTGIGFYTAFAVFGFRRLLEYFSWEVQGIWNLLPWIAPSLVGIPAIAIWISRMKRKYERPTTDGLAGSKEAAKLGSAQS